VDTDVLAPGRYMKLPVDQIAPHCLESVRPEFSKQVKSGDFVVAGRNFGAGSSREQAPAALKQLGVAALIAESFAGLFYRNSLNLGLPALVCPDAKRIQDRDDIAVDFETSTISTPRGALKFEPIPGHLLEMVRDGGLLAHLEKRLKK
jgi:3-isopropylmalate/(R)-2-methylmalate dehydratase small subunit